LSFRQVISRSAAPSKGGVVYRASSSLCSTAEDDNSGWLSRRRVNEILLASTGLSITAAGTYERTPQDYGLWGILPVGPYKRKKTIMDVVVDGKIWTFDQKFGILNVQVPIRCTVVKIANGLLVYNPIAATKEFLGLLQPVIDQHGPIRHVVLGTVGLEHKVYAGVFAQKFKEAKVWLQPGVYSFPVDLPNSFLGFPKGRTSYIPQDAKDSEWKDEFDQATIGPLISRDGGFGETVLYHRETRTLLVTDTVLEVTEEVPRIFDDDHAPLLYHARDTMEQVLQDDEATRKIGWRRVVLFGLFFQPSAIRLRDRTEALTNRRPDINPDFAGIYPFDWVGDDVKSFKALTGGLLVAPILQKLILNRNPVEALDFADKVASWDFDRIIPGHLKNNLRYGGKDFKDAFLFLTADGPKAGLPNPLPGDLQTLEDAQKDLLISGAIAPAPPLPGTKGVSRQDIIDQSTYNCRGEFCSPRAAANSINLN